VKKGSKKGQKTPTNQRLNNSILVQIFYYLYGHFERFFVTTRDQKLPIFWHFWWFLRPPHFTNCLKIGNLTKIYKTLIFYQDFNILAKPPIIFKISKDDSLLAHKNVLQYFLKIKFIVVHAFMLFNLAKSICCFIHKLVAERKLNPFIGRSERGPNYTIRHIVRTESIFQVKMML